VNPGQEKRHRQQTAPQLPEAEAPPTDVETPKADPAAKVKASLPKALGGTASAEFDVEAGDLWINLNCRGAGEVSVSFEPLDTFSIQCTPDQVLATRNQVNLIQNHHLKLVVTAPETVEWAVLAEQ
jgi:hypothetical protein